jgi:hypothetical protein
MHVSNGCNNDSSGEGENGGGSVEAFGFGLSIVAVVVDRTKSQAVDGFGIEALLGRPTSRLPVRHKARLPLTARLSLGSGDWPVSLLILIRPQPS